MLPNAFFVNLGFWFVSFFSFSNKESNARAVCPPSSLVPSFQAEPTGSFQPCTVLLLKPWISHQRHPNERDLLLPPWHLNPEITASRYCLTSTKPATHRGREDMQNQPQLLQTKKSMVGKSLSALSQCAYGRTVTGVLTPCSHPTGMQWAAAMYLDPPLLMVKKSQLELRKP